MYSKIHQKKQLAPDDLSGDDIARTNGLMTILLRDVMEYLKLQHNTDVLCHSDHTTDSTSEKELTQMLLLNIFNGCAMTYRGCEIQAMKDLNGTESLICGQPCIKYFTGSSYEGVGCANPAEYSDLDTMHVLQNFVVIISEGSDTNRERSHETDSPAQFQESQFMKEANNIHDDTSDTHGKHADSKTTGYKFGSQNVVEDRDSNYQQRPSGVAVKPLKTGKSKFPGYITLVADETESEVRDVTKSLNYGPVIRRDRTEMLLAHKFEFDDAIAVECNIWPVEALDWYTRPKLSNWPDRTLMEQCRRTPCYIVRKPHATNLDDVHEWRFSFARHEAMLLRSLTVKTKMIYILTKVLLKASALQDNCLTTYHLKTMFLWFLEKHSVDKLQEKELEENVKVFLSFVLQHVKDHTFPNYFIPDNNMIAHFSKDDMKEVLKQIENILTNFTLALSTVKTAYVYPFSTASIAANITEDPSMRSRCLVMLHSNLLNIITDHLLSIHIPKWDVIWLYCRYFPILMKNRDFSNPEDSIPEALMTVATVQKDSALMYRIHKDAFLKLGMLFCSHIEENLQELSIIAKQLLTGLINLQDDPLANSNNIAYATCTISFQHGVRATERCCNLWKHILQPGEPVATVFMLILKQMMSLREGGVKHERDYLIGCLAAVVHTLQVPKNDIEVGIATGLRLRWSLQPIKLLAGILKMVSMHNVMKQFAYLWVLNLEESMQKNETYTDTEEPSELDRSKESNNALGLAIKMCTETGLGTGVQLDAFAFIVAVIVFQKMTLDEPNVELVKNILKDLQSSKVSKGLPKFNELASDIASLVQTESVDVNHLFMFAASYTVEGVLSAGFDFALSVLDELTKPHYNLGILAVIWEELFSSGAHKESMAVMETWISRATGAPVTQNPLLTVQMYGKLGHLYHVQSISKHDEEPLKRPAAHVLFRTALKENVVHPAVIIDFLLFIWEENLDEFDEFLEQACMSDDIQCVSSFSPHSAEVLCHIADLHAEVISRKVVRISSVVLAHYITVHRKKQGVRDSQSSVAETSQAKPRDHVTEMLQVIRALEALAENTGMGETNKEVLVGSNYVLGLAACQMDTYDVAVKAFNRVLELDPTYITVDGKIQEISSKHQSVSVLYSRQDD